MVLMAWQLPLGFVTTFDQLKYPTQGCCADKIHCAQTSAAAWLVALPNATTQCKVPSGHATCTDAMPEELPTSSYSTGLLQHDQGQGKIRQMLPVLCTVRWCTSTSARTEPMNLVAVDRGTLTHVKWETSHGQGQSIAWCSSSCGAMVSPCYRMLVAMVCSLTASYSSGRSGRAPNDVHSVHNACTGDAALVKMPALPNCHPKCMMWHTGA